MTILYAFAGLAGIILRLARKTCASGSPVLEACGDQLSFGHVVEPAEFTA
jgi:hypothetical protein